MAIGSVPSAVVGVYVLEALERAYGGDFDSLLLTLVAAAILFSGVAEANRAGARGSPPRWVGIFVGFVLGVTSAGSGALIAVALIYIFRLVARSCWARCQASG
jgi:uncharacterized membrane protein YfcA